MGQGYMVIVIRLRFIHHLKYMEIQQMTFIGIEALIKPLLLQ